MHRSSHISRHASARVCPRRISTHALCRSPRAMPLVTGSHARRLLYSTRSTSQASDATLAAVRRTNAIVLGSVAISASATAAWSMRCYNTYTMSHLFNATTRFTKAVCHGVAAGCCVMATGAFLAPTALALGPCLGMALLTLPVTGIVQTAIGFAYIKDAAPGGNRNQWFTETILAP